MVQAMRRILRTRAVPAIRGDVRCASSLRAPGPGPVCTHLSVEPKVAPTAFVAPNATILGDVTLHENASVWHSSVLRADINSIVIGKNSNVQDLTCIHLASDQGVSLGANVTVGHSAVLHACTIGDNVLVGMKAVIMDKAEIGSGSIVGAGALVPPGKRFPPNSLIVGSPAARKRDTTPEEREMIAASAAKYVRVAAEHRAFLQKQRQQQQQTSKGKP